MEKEKYEVRMYLDGDLISVELTDDLLVESGIFTEFGTRLWHLIIYVQASNRDSAIEFASNFLKENNFKPNGKRIELSRQYYQAD